MMFPASFGRSYIYSIRPPNARPPSGSGEGFRRAWL